MSDFAPPKIITQDDLLKWGAEDRWVEVVDGEIRVMSPVGVRYVLVVNNVYDTLNPHVKQHRLGYVMTDSLIYVLLEDKDAGVRISRIPDVSFIRRGRITPQFNIDKPFPGAPDLAIEVVSPSEDETNILEKVRDYLAYGAEETWVLYPSPEEVHRYRQSEPRAIQAYLRDDVLEADNLFPGLKINVADFFALPEEFVQTATIIT